jgi:hypothetical protein
VGRARGLVAHSAGGPSRHGLRQSPQPRRYLRSRVAAIALTSLRA